VFYASFFIQAVIYGGFLIVNNLVIPIGSAYGCNAGAVLVVVMSLTNTLGRTVCGHITGYFDNHLVLTEWFAVIAGFIAVLDFVLAFTSGNSGVFIMLVALNGGMYGFLIVATTSNVINLFGTSDLMVNDAIFDLCSAVGSFSMAYGLVAAFPVERNQDDDDGLGCVGAECFQNIFIASGSLAVAACVCALFLAQYVRKVVRDLQVAKSQAAQQNRGYKTESVGVVSS
jgi:hypothetical protein